MEISNLQLILITVILIIYSSLDGIDNSLITARRGFLAYKWNEHIVFVLQRGCIVALLAVLLPIRMSIAISIIFAALFSFWHNGFYGLSLNRIGLKEYGWWYNSKTSTARIEIKALPRTIMFILSLVLLTYLVTNN